MATTDRQVEQQIAQDAAAAAAPDTPVTPGIFQAAQPSGAIVLPDGSKAPGSATMAGPIAQGAGPLGPAANFSPTPSPTTVQTVDSTGNVIGITTTTYNWDGTPNTPQYTQIASTGATGSATQTNQANAAAQAIALLESYGLSADIGAGLTALAQNGLDSTTIISILDAPNPTTAITGLNLQGSQLTAANQLVTSWQARFPGNQARIAAGLNPIDPATYIANETAYKQVMTMAGIPASSPLMQTSYLGNLMAQDVSPAEVASRVSTATSAIQNEDPMVIAQLQSQFGLSQSSLVSHLLDPTVTAPVIQQEYNAATIAAEAARAGVAITVGNTGGNVQGGGLLNNNSLQMQLAAQGVTQSQAQQGFQAIAAEQPALQSIAGRYGAGVTGPQNVGQALTAATFNTTGAAAAQQQINLLKTAEASAFSGSAGAVTGSLGPRDTSGLQ